MTLTRALQIEFNDPSAEWETVNAWFVRQKNMDMRLRHNGEAIAGS